MPPYITTSRYHLSRKLRTKPTDICFVSYPKSGSTWLSYILVLLTSPSSNLDSHSRGDTLRNSLQWVESSWTYSRFQRRPGQGAGPANLQVAHAVLDGAGWGSGRAGVQRQTPKMCASATIGSRAGRVGAGSSSPAGSCGWRCFAAGRCKGGIGSSMLLGWWRASREQGGKGNILFLTFEDMKRDTAGQIRRIAEFLNVEVTGVRLEQVMRKIGFEEMQKTAFSGLKDVKEFNEFFRKGEIGSWKDQFNVRQAEEFDKLSKGRMKESGLDFVFE
ncbi:MAG: hypothetical protein Q9180_007725 [Flavoplaca navasiana]